LQEIKKNNIGRLIIVQLNINSIRNKIEALKFIIKDSIHLLVLTETKLDDSYPTSQFLIPGFGVPFRLDRNTEGGGVLMYVNNDIACKQLKFHDFPNDIEGMFIEKNLHNKKWLIFGGYNRRKQQINFFLDKVGKALDKYISDYENIILLGDFNSETCEKDMKEFLEIYNLQNLIKKPTCFKNATSPTTIDLILTNKKRSFQDSEVIETGLSDFHKMTVTVLKVLFKKLSPIVITYRDYKKFNKDLFCRELQHEFNQSNLTDLDYNGFHCIFMKCLNSHASIKKKYLRGNNSPFMNKTISMAIMLRSRLKNKYNKNSNKFNLNAYKKTKKQVC